MSMAKTFVYVSNAQDGNIDAYIMDTSTGALTPIGKTEAAKLVMPMAVSPNKKYLYAVIRSQPVRVLTYAIDPANRQADAESFGAASGQHALCFDRSHRTLPVHRLLWWRQTCGEPDRRKWTGRGGSDSGHPHWPQCTFDPARSAATNSSTRPRSAPIKCCSSFSTARPASSRQTSQRQSARKQVTALATWLSRRTTRTSMCSTSYRDTSRNTRSMPARAH